MIKMEVDARLNSDKETKNLVQNLLKGVMQEVATIKENADRQIKKL
jgi:ethanolamine utilization protein EutQ (cupin superfamily)